MIINWTKHCKSQEEKERFEQSVLAARPVLERLQTILNEAEDGQNKAERDTRIYDSPNWDYKQAHLNGFRDCLNKVKVIINLDQGTND